MAVIGDLFEGLLFGGKKQKQPEPPPLPPPDDVSHDISRTGGLPSFVRTEGRLRGAITPPLKKVLGVEK